MLPLLILYNILQHWSRQERERETDGIITINSFQYLLLIMRLVFALRPTYVPTDMGVFNLHAVWRPSGKGSPNCVIFSLLQIANICSCKSHPTYYYFFLLVEQNRCDCSVTRFGEILPLWYYVCQKNFGHFERIPLVIGKILSLISWITFKF